MILFLLGRQYLLLYKKNNVNDSFDLASSSQATQVGESAEVSHFGVAPEHSLFTPHMQTPVPSVELQESVDPSAHVLFVAPILH